MLIILWTAGHNNYINLLVNLYPLVISFASSLKSGNSSLVISVATFLLDVSVKYFIFSISFFDADINYVNVPLITFISNYYVNSTTYINIPISFINAWLLTILKSTPSYSGQVSRGPGGPVGPAGPTAPGNPLSPGGPLTPGFPTDPLSPCEPGNPATPRGPITPFAPLNPLGPDEPFSPGSPLSPISPSKPLGHPVGHSIAK